MQVSIAAALARLPAAPTPQYPEGAPSCTVMHHGSMQVKVFTPVFVTWVVFYGPRGGEGGTAALV